VWNLLVVLDRHCVGCESSLSRLSELSSSFVEEDLSGSVWQKVASYFELPDWAANTKTGSHFLIFAAVLANQREVAIVHGKTRDEYLLTCTCTQLRFRSELRSILQLEI
jgi:hypothetical protein